MNENDKKDLERISHYIPDDLKSDFSKLVTSYLDRETGREINNPTPLVLHPDIEKPMSIAERIEWILNRRLSHNASQRGLETLEESQDFEIRDDEFEALEQSIYQTVDYDVKLMDEDEIKKPTPPADIPPAGETKKAGTILTTNSQDVEAADQ